MDLKSDEHSHLVYPYSHPTHADHFVLFSIVYIPGFLLLLKIYAQLGSGGMLSGAVSCERVPGS